MDQMYGNLVAPNEVTKPLILSEDVSTEMSLQSFTKCLLCVREKKLAGTLAVIPS